MRLLLVEDEPSCGKALPESCTVQGMKQMTAVMGNRAGNAGGRAV